MRPLTMPPGCRVIYNYLYDHTDIEFLDEDIASIVLPSGRYLDVGWYPQFNPSGEYRIVEVSKSYRARYREATAKTAKEVQEILFLWCTQ